MKKSQIVILSIILATATLLIACGQTDSGETGMDTSESVFGAVKSVPRTEEELRQAISQMGDDNATLTQKQEYYQRLLAMDVFGETDYVALADIYGTQGEWEKQRDMLWKVLRLHPSKEYAQRLEEIVIRWDDTETEMAELAEQTMEALRQQDTDGLRRLIVSEEWRHVAQKDMTGVTTRTQYRSDGNLLQATTGLSAAELTFREETGAFYCYKSDESGFMWASVEEFGENYNGVVSVVCWDAEGNVIRECSGILKDGVCVDQITVLYQGMEYAGKLNSDGTTAQEQYPAVTEQGGVVYAAGSDGVSYLVQENETVEHFKIDSTYLGLPEYVEWK